MATSQLQSATSSEFTNSQSFSNRISSNFHLNSVYCNSWSHHHRFQPDSYRISLSASNLNQFLQYRQSHQLRTPSHRSISAILAPPTRASSHFSPIAILPLFFPPTARPARARFFARSSLFLEVAARAALSPAHARDIFLVFGYRCTRSNCSPRFCFSTFRCFNMVIWIKFISRVTDGILWF